MAKNKKILSLLLLYPISRVYGWAMSLRNWMFNHGVLKQHSFDIPVIVVGNISMGGSGKTPHTEFVVDALRKDYRIGVLSRGYKRKTHGFVLASPNSHVSDIGDEPFQIYRKFKDKGVMMAVCEDRVTGIRRMLEVDPKLSLIVLDDAFQHRYVKPTLSVVLMEYNRPAWEDSLLPYGRLREPMHALNRADVVVVTKCPGDMKPMEGRIFKTNLNLFPYQKLLFSRYEYLRPQPLFAEAGADTQFSLSMLSTADTILAVTGVANPRPFIRHLRQFKAKVKLKCYADHHNFTHSDMDSIYEKFANMGGKRKVLITTEKDAMRLLSNPYFPHKLRACSYYIPIRVTFDDFNDTDLGEVLKPLLRTSNTLRR